MAESQAMVAEPHGRGDVAVPPHWPRALRSRRVALLGWARLAFQAVQGSGYNLSASELAAGLAMSGHEVFYLASGRRYSLRPWQHLEHTERWRGVECFDLYNSPNLSPALYNFTNMRTEHTHGHQTRLVLRWLERQRIEVVHVHSLEGFPLDLVASIRNTGRPVVITPHNYWYVCPQVDLMENEVRICHDYQGGARCTGCLKPSPALHTRLKRRIGHTFERIVGFEAAAHMRKGIAELPLRMREITGRRAAGVGAAREPDAEEGRGFDAGDHDHDGLLRHGFGPSRGDRVRRPLGAAHEDDNERFLGAEHHLTVLNNYGQRRLAGIAALNQASLVIPPSDFVRRTYTAMGLREELTRTVRLGQPHFDQINRRAQRSPHYGVRPWDPQQARRPLRLAFLGSMRPSKGIDIVAAAIELLPRDVRQRCQFLFRAIGFDWPVRRRLARYPEVSFAGPYDLLQLIGAAGDYDVGILPHVWFENSPLILLEHLHAGKFVICSRLGGPVEWVVPPRNGLMVAGGHADLLARAIEDVVTGRVSVPSPREIHDATPILRSYPDHVREVAEIYEEVLRPAQIGHGAGQRGAAPAGSGLDRERGAKRDERREEASTP
jgi:glycosyltransferase involved in cell wall biosynthesis